MDNSKKNNKTILLAFQSYSDMNYLSEVLSSDCYRIIRAGNFLSLIDALDHYRIHLIISEVNIPGISMINFLPFLRKRYSNIKVIIAMKDYSPRLELSLRQYNILYVIPWPVSRELLKSLVEKGLERREKDIIIG